MQIALLPELNDDEKRQVKDWLQRILRSERLVVPGSGRSNYPLSHDRIVVYVDGRARYLYYGIWSLDAQYIRVGQDSPGFELGARLAVLAAIISVAGLWAELTDEYTTAVSRTLLESYNTAMRGLIRVQGGTPATGLAFSADRMQVAAQFGDSWTLPNGEGVAIDESWTIVR